MTDHRASARRAYEAWHRDLPFATDAQTPWFTLLEKVLDPGRDLSGRIVLEVGCGRGELSWWLASGPEPPRRVIAGDLALTAVHKGATRGGATLEEPAPPGGPGPFWHVTDISRLALPDASCDTVISCETVEHVPSPGRAIRELARVLKPGGRLFLTTPNYLNAVGLYRAYRRLVNRPFQEAGQPINRLMSIPRTLWSVRRAGLKVLAVDGLGHPLPLPGGAVEMTAFDHLGPLGRWTGVQSLVLAEKPPADGAGVAA